MPLAVMLVVEAPPIMEKSPAVMVEEALERNPLANVVRPVYVLTPLMVREPRVAACEKRLVDLAVVAKKAVDVAPPCPIEKTVVLAFVTASKNEPVPHVVSTLSGVDVPMPTLPRWFIRICSWMPVAPFVVVQNDKPKSAPAVSSTYDLMAPRVPAVPLPSDESNKTCEATDSDVQVPTLGEVTFSGMGVAPVKPLAPSICSNWSGEAAPMPT